MTTLARNQSDRVSGLVYLDALGDLEDDPSADPEWLALLKKVPTELRPQPVCDPGHEHVRCVSEVLGLPPRVRHSGIRAPQPG